ncbi:GNAT family N-acetyltransferase [Pseudooceanicola spongiae]|nr:GNAT family N-acetyltransferase [Pseudooceanicola spongiae]
MHAITLSDATNVDPSALADIRVEAMRPSLEAVGRFDPERARNRFLETYDSRDTRVVWSGEDLIGFYVVRDRSDHLYLDHIYIRPDHQGGGLGRRIVRSVQDRAREAGLPLRLMALRDSPANAFYISLGFGLESSDALDNYYTWNPD